MSDNSIQVTYGSVDGDAMYYDEVFPLVVECQTAGPSLSNVTDWVGTHQEKLLAEVAQHGAVFFPRFSAQYARRLRRICDRLRDGEFSVCGVAVERGAGELHRSDLLRE